jgi:peptidoglycan/LPS O-acetylase OafA/YrhL
LAKLHVIRSASFPVRAFISNVPLLQNLGAGYIAPGFAAYLDPPSWSISTEAGAYLLFPALASLALFRPPRSAVGLSVLCGGVLFALSVVPRPWLNQPAGLGALDISSGETLWPLLRCLAGFCIGLVAYRLSFRLTSWRRTAAADIILVAALAGLWYADVSDFAIVCLFPLLILQVCTDRSPLARWLGTWLPYRLGLWSYAIYLLHWPALDLLNPIEGLLRRHDAPRPHLTALLVLAMLLIGASAALYEGFEKPARNFLRRGFGQRRTTTAMEPSAP